MATKLPAPPMVYILGEEMTRYAMGLILDQWIAPHVDTRAWEFYDLSCVSRDKTQDQVLKDAIAAGARIKAIFKEPTITPTAEQAKEIGLSKAWGSPNGAMRRGWNGIAISCDTLHIPGIELGYKKPVLFERQAIGGEYSAGYKIVGRGLLKTLFYPEGGEDPVVVDERKLTESENAAVTYHNPYDTMEDFAHHFFSRALEGECTPYVVTKKTVFKWQEPFWTRMKAVFDAEYKEKFKSHGLLKDTRGHLAHLISDAATMKLIAWKHGGFAMAAHNYDGDMLTDLMSQVHRSPGFISSVLTGKAEDGTPIKEFEASHGTVSDMEQARLRGEETSLNPLGLVDALIGAMNHSAKIAGAEKEMEMKLFTNRLRTAMTRLMTTGNGTRDLAGPTGLTTEQFIEAVAREL